MRRLYGDDVIWSGDEDQGFIPDYLGGTQHRLQ